MHGCIDKESEKLIEDFAAQVVILDPGDIPGMGAVLKIADFLTKCENQPVKLVAIYLKEYVEKLILEEESDFTTLEKGVTVLQDISKEYQKESDADERIVKRLLEKIQCGVNFEVNNADEKEGESPVFLSASEDIQLYIEFAAESLENLENAEVDLISLEENPEDKSLINSVFRAFHTIKGVSGFLELSHINHLAHKTETLLDNIRQGALNPEPEITDIILSAIDLMKKMISDIPRSVEETGSLSNKVWEIELFLEKIENAVNPPEDRPLGEMLIQQGKVTQKDVKASLKKQESMPDKKIGEILVEDKKTSTKEIATALRKQRNNRKSNYQVKVDTDKLDTLVDLTGELVIAQSILKEQSKLAGNLDNRFVQSMGHMNQIVSSVQRISMSMRMVPIGNTFQKMIRVVRDVSSNLGKKVELEMDGKDTEVDRNMVDALYEPLVHMVRNSVDHGIEAPLERSSKGKPPYGNILLASYHKAGNIVIEISDDGKGLDKEIIFSKAVEKGLISEDSKLSEKEIFHLIFHPGFSTTTNVTDVSGRGVGMDVVKEAIEDLKGHLEISSGKDKGTNFTIRLPLTMAIIDGMLIRVGLEKYIVPTMSILEAIPFDKSNYFTIEKRGEMVRARGKMVPLVRIENICAGTRKKSYENENRLVLIVENKGLKCGLLLDELLGKDEFVIKNLGDVFSEAKVFSGGAILGDGRVGLIIDIAGLFDWADV